MIKKANQESLSKLKLAMDALDKIKDKPDPVNHPPHYKAGVSRLSTSSRLKILITDWVTW